MIISSCLPPHSSSHPELCCPGTPCGPPRCSRTSCSALRWTSVPSSSSSAGLSSTDNPACTPTHTHIQSPTQCRASQEPKHRPLVAGGSPTSLRTSPTISLYTSSMAMLIMLLSIPLVIFPEFIRSRKTQTVMPLCWTESWEKKSSNSPQLNSILIAMHTFLRRYSTWKGKETSLESEKKCDSFELSVFAALYSGEEATKQITNSGNYFFYYYQVPFCTAF